MIRDDYRPFQTFRKAKTDWQRKREAELPHHLQPSHYPTVDDVMEMTERVWTAHNGVKLQTVLR